MMNVIFKKRFYCENPHEPIYLPCPQFHEIMMDFLMIYEYVGLYVC